MGDTIRDIVVTSVGFQHTLIVAPLNIYSLLPYNIWGVSDDFSFSPPLSDWTAESVHGERATTEACRG